MYSLVYGNGRCKILLSCKIQAIIHNVSGTVLVSIQVIFLYHMCDCEDIFCATYFVTTHGYQLGKICLEGEKVALICITLHVFDTIKQGYCWGQMSTHSIMYPISNTTNMMNMADTDCNLKSHISLKLIYNCFLFWPLWLQGFINKYLTINSHVLNYATAADTVILFWVSKQISSRSWYCRRQKETQEWMLLTN